MLELDNQQQKGETKFNKMAPQSEIYRRGNVENGWKSLIMVDHAWKCQ